MIEPDEVVRLDDTEIAVARARRRTGGRRNRQVVHAQAGRHVRSERVDDLSKGFELAVDATLRAVALRVAGQGGGMDGGVAPVDLRQKVRERAAGSLVVFVVDVSDSMRTDERVAAAKGAVLSLLVRAYQNRDRIAVISFGGDNAEVVLAPTRSTTRARERLTRLPAGGATPLADGLHLAIELLERERRRDPRLASWMMVLTDGEANVPRQPGRLVWPELMAAADEVRRKGIRALVVDTSPRSPSADRLRRWAESMGGRYVAMGRVRTRSVLQILDAARKE